MDLPTGQYNTLNFYSEYCWRHRLQPIVPPMAFIRRLFTLTAFACLSGLIGLGVGFLFAPAKGSDTRAWVASLVNQHSPSVQEGMRKAGESVDTAVDYVASQVDAITDGN